VSELEAETSFGCYEASEDESASADMSDSGLASTGSLDDVSSSGTTGNEAVCKDDAGVSACAQQAKRKHRTQRQPPIGSAPVRGVSPSGRKSSKLNIPLEPVDEKPAWANAFEEALTTGMSNLMRKGVDTKCGASLDYG